MAIYHLHVKVIGRKAGSSAVASAAYRSASRMRDERLDRVQDFSAKRGVVHSEVMLPDGAPEHLGDRERLWNDVEAFEVRKDAQLAREVEFAIPREMTQAQGIGLARDFARDQFVDQGMIADLNVHWDIGEDGMPKPHAHVMLTMRSVDENGFGQKVRDWNRTEMVERWRERWAEHVNERLAELDIDARIDHRSLEAQGIGLEPQSQIGAPAQRIEGEGLDVADRAELHREIARNNGDRIIADPSVALDAITQQQSTFTRRDMAMFAHRHSDGIEQYNEVMGAMRNAPDLVELGQDGRGDDRFTTRDMIEAEQRLHRAAEMMAEKERHEVSARDREAALARAGQRGLVLSGEQAEALAHVTDGRDLGIVVGYAGTGKSAMLGVAREAWEAAGYEVRGVALSGIAAENLEGGSGIASRTIASMEHGWKNGRDMLTARDVLVIDEAGMVGTRQMERVLSHAAEAGAKVVLVGDPQQLQSIEAGAAWGSLSGVKASKRATAATMAATTAGDSAATPGVSTMRPPVPVRRRRSLSWRMRALDPMVAVLAMREHSRKGCGAGNACPRGCARGRRRHAPGRVPGTPELGGSPAGGDIGGVKQGDVLGPPHDTAELGPVAPCQREQVAAHFHHDRVIPALRVGIVLGQHQVAGLERRPAGQPRRLGLACGGGRADRAGRFRLVLGGGVAV